MTWRLPVALLLVKAQGRGGRGMEQWEEEMGSRIHGWLGGGWHGCHEHTGMLLKAIRNASGLLGSSILRTAMPDRCFC